MVSEYYESNANVHRGVHFLSQQATEMHEGARERVRSFINAHSIEEVVFTRGTTEGLNLVAFSYGEAFLKPGDEVILTVMEHHSNIVPWQMLRERKGIAIIYITHRQTEVFEIATHVAIMRDGVITLNGPVDNFTKEMLIQGLLPKAAEALQSSDSRWS